MFKMKADFDAGIKLALSKMSEALGEETLRSAGYAGAKVFKDEMIARVPVDKGVIKRNIIVVRAKEKSKGNEMQIYYATVRTGKQNTEGDAFYWRWVEQGHKIVRRRKAKESMKAARAASEIEYGNARVPAKPFMRPSWDAKKEEALEAVRIQLRTKIAEKLK